MSKNFSTIFIIFIIIFIILKTGIKIDSITYFNYKIKNISLAIDKKFHLRVKRIEILKINDTESNTKFSE